MLKDRRYFVSYEEIEMSFEKFQEFYRDIRHKKELNITSSHLFNLNDRIMIFFVEHDGEKDKLINKSILSCYGMMQEKQVYRSIIILPSKLNSRASKYLQSLHDVINGLIVIETFEESELIVNITEHILVPIHQLLTNEEKNDVLRRYKVKEAQLPRIQIKDPVAKYLGLVRGDVVRIIRQSETAGRYVTYRSCI
jgi:DNA-directed RNA polymerase I, II, and III subunit RPABC1